MLLQRCSRSQRACVSAEFRALAGGASSPVTVWLRALAGFAHAECGGPGVGAIGMTFTQFVECSVPTTLTAHLDAGRHDGSGARRPFARISLPSSSSPPG